MDKVIILAAGKGTRMKSELPKVLAPLNGRPIIDYLIEAVIASGICTKPLLVVSPDNQSIIANALSKYDLDYALQTEQLGTGHAVNSARPLLASQDYENIVILYGDHPFIRPATLQKIIKNHRGALTMMTTTVEDFSGWRQNFYHWGRIIRSQGKISGIVEYKDANDDQKNITEVNPALFCCNSRWLWQKIEKIKNNNSQKEYYLTSLVALAAEEGETIGDLAIDQREAVGINSPEELLVAASLIS